MKQYTKYPLIFLAIAIIMGAKKPSTQPTKTFCKTSQNLTKLYHSPVANTPNPALKISKNRRLKIKNSTFKGFYRVATSQGDFYIQQSQCKVIKSVKTKLTSKQTEPSKPTPGIKTSPQKRNDNTSELSVVPTQPLRISTPKNEDTRPTPKYPPSSSTQSPTPKPIRNPPPKKIKTNINLPTQALHPLCGCQTCVITSPMSHKRKHPILKKVRPHTGIDYSGQSGKTPVRTTFDGVIVKIHKQSNWFSTGGNWMQVKHEGNLIDQNGKIRSRKIWFTRYLHLDNREIAKFSAGMSLKKGDIIGYVGNTGLSTGPHLHYEFRTAKYPSKTEIDYLNPLDFFPKEYGDQYIPKTCETSPSPVKVRPYDRNRESTIEGVNI